ncbi:MAG TPA: peptide chain release factor N(5)-glutamine methyltransferase [Flavobacteriales bacterium]|nr:peptide chain release factor N(5)-glutamine methyltransferase [Flavobacteriales bacterium]
MPVKVDTLQGLLARYREALGTRYSEGEIKAITRSLAQHVIGLDPAQLELKKFESLNESDALRMHKPLERLIAGEPLQHILGEVEFHGLRLKVSREVLIPRPETEELVERIIASGIAPKRIVDVGTGSGCIALALKKAYPEAQVWGVDVSRMALEIACTNAERNGLEVDWQQADVLADDFAFADELEIVVSNPPYIPSGEADLLDEHVRSFEPHVALFAPDADPLLFYRVIGEKAWSALCPGGHIWFEGHWRHAQAVGDLLSSIGYSDVRVVKDMDGQDRFIHGRR